MNANNFEKLLNSQEPRWRCRAKKEQFNQVISLSRGYMQFTKLSLGYWQFPLPSPDRLHNIRRRSSVDGHRVHIALSVIWIAVATGWFACIALIERMIGGYQFIVHTEMTRPVAMLALMTGLSLACALLVLARRPLPKALSIAVAALAALHLVNAIGMIIFLSTNGRPGAIMLPFALISKVVPTSTQFLGMPPGNASLLILPVATLLVWLATVAIKPRADASVNT